MSKVDRVGVGINYAPLAYCDQDGKLVTELPSPQLATHRFSDEGGQIAHYIDGRLRALVPPEGFDDYARLWPDCAELVVAMRPPAPVLPPPVPDPDAAPGS